MKMLFLFDGAVTAATAVVVVDDDEEEEEDADGDSGIGIDASMLRAFLSFQQILLSTKCCPSHS